MGNWRQRPSGRLGPVRRKVGGGWEELAGLRGCEERPQALAAWLEAALVLLATGAGGGSDGCADNGVFWQWHGSAEEAQ